MTDPRADGLGYLHALREVLKMPVCRLRSGSTLVEYIAAVLHFSSDEVSFQIVETPPMVYNWPFWCLDVHEDFEMLSVDKGKMMFFLFELLNCIKFSNLALSSTNALLIIDMMMDLNILREESETKARDIYLDDLKFNHFANELANHTKIMQNVNYINAHATSTIAGDLAEINAIKKVFKDTSGIKINATKSMIGHCLGAAGGLEAIASVKAITTGWLHPSINQFSPEPSVEFDTVANKKQQHEVNVESETAHFNHVCLQLFRILLDLVDTTPSWSFLHSSLEHLASVHLFPCIKAPSIQLVCISRGDQSCLGEICSSV
ncbi:hypothetical protein NC653_011422 [Populus alba x Populus x berolinensis]|uniref:beta-ketoacyl-[acyl-carrier-protein] synthase I n=1 Tax=Populus alba x Populus x berolinensis TaxID=444605 RepID=A0AAD6R297_9ROSI|nr:hypothetical protein NC653_011422 [Populus alba x Populus x berolinensis]